MPYFVYILRCKDNSLYTGITTDVARRFLEHKNGKGAKYTRANPPLEIVYTRKCRTKSAALKSEIKIKRLKRVEKIKLIES